MNKYLRYDKFEASQCVKTEYYLPPKGNLSFLHVSQIRFLPQVTRVLVTIIVMLQSSWEPPATKTLPSAQISSLSLCHFIKRCNCIKSLFIVALNLFNAVYSDRNSNLDCDRYFAQMDILYQ